MPTGMSVKKLLAKCSKFCRCCRKPLVLKVMRDLRRKEFCSYACRQRVLNPIAASRRPIPSTRKCSRCKEIRPVDDFYRNTKSKYVRFSAYCRNCQREMGIESRVRNFGSNRNHSLVTRYGINESEYSEMVRVHENACAICRLPVTGKLFVDHDHKTGGVRGLLCSPCNSVLGRWLDDPLVAERAAAYLRMGGFYPISK